MKLKINNDNYYSKEVRCNYISSSLLKSMFGCGAMEGCEARTMAELKGEYKRDKTPALLIGGYVDAYFEGTLKEYIEKNPQINKISVSENNNTIKMLSEIDKDKWITRNGNIKSNMLSKAKTEHPECFTVSHEIKAEYSIVNDIISTAEKDEYFMSYMKGEKQKIVTGKIYNIPFIGKLDVTSDLQIVDLKVMKDFNDIYSKQKKSFLNWIKAWGIIDQLAIYYELEYQMTGIYKNVYIAALTKEKVPDKEIIFIPVEYLEEAILDLKNKIIRAWGILQGNIEPKGCGKCDYCRGTKKLTKTKIYNE